VCAVLSSWRVRTVVQSTCWTSFGDEVTARARWAVRGLNYPVPESGASPEIMNSFVVSGEAKLADDMTLK